VSIGAIETERRHVEDVWARMRQEATQGSRAGLLGTIAETQ
jgi:hypothetical protein